MFKRITYTLLAAAMAFGAAVDTTATAPAAPAADATTSAAATSLSTGYVPKFKEAEVAAAKNAPVFEYCVNPKHIALTFDDGPSIENTPIVLDFLKKNNIQATFFINGRNTCDLETNQDAVNLVKRIHQEGHYIGSHTYYHQTLFNATIDGTMEMNIDKMGDKIEEIIGVKPAYFRPPQGEGGYATNPENQEMNDKIQKYLGAGGYNIIMWGADTNDWFNKKNVDADIENLKKDMKRTDAGYIVLMHDIHAESANDALPRVVEYLKGLGYSFVSLPECIGVQPYQEVKQVAPPSELKANNTTTKEVKTNDASIVQNNMIFSAIALILSVLFLY